MLSLGHLFLVLLIVFLLFGAQRFPKMMEDLAKGYKAFMQGIQTPEPQPSPSAPLCDGKPTEEPSSPPSAQDTLPKAPQS